MNILNFYDASVRKSLRYVQKMRQYHYWNKLYSRNIKRIEGEELNDQEKEEVKAFFKPYTKINLVFHSYYKKIRGSFKKEFIPDDLYYGHIDPYYNDWEMARYFDNKCLYRTLFSSAKQPVLVTYRMNGFWYNSIGEVISLDDAIACILNANTDCFIKQATESDGGHGVTFVAQNTSADVIYRLLSGINNDIVVQEKIIQCETLSRINESSINTIRLMTLLRQDGTVKVCSAILRMGVNGSKIDNASSGGCFVGIKEDGTLRSTAYNYNCEIFNQHPTSHVNFEDFKIPNFEQIKELVKRLAVNTPHFRLVSWDVALAQNDEPIFLEANFNFGAIDLHQLTNGPLFGEETEDVLREVFTRK